VDQEDRARLEVQGDRVNLGDQPFRNSCSVPPVEVMVAMVVKVETVAKEERVDGADPVEALLLHLPRTSWKEYSLLTYLIHPPSHRHCCTLRLHPIRSRRQGLYCGLA